MMHRKHRKRLYGLAFLSGIVLVALWSASARAESDPWTAAQTVKPRQLLEEIADPKTAPTIAFVGFGRLFNAGHIKGAQFHGSGGSAEGLKEFKAWASGLPTTTHLVIYCGCCPLEHCPNIRPAFVALRQMGFTNVRVLLLPNSFEADWAGQGLPYEKSR
jgi:hypothetical protein